MALNHNPHKGLSHKWVEKWEVPSNSSDKSYVVAVSEDWVWACSCPVWKFRRQECKHIQRQKREMVSQQKTRDDILKPQPQPQMTMTLPEKKRILDLTD